MMHQAAWERNFFGAARRAFLGDGLPVNWTIQRRHFAPFTPILDFVHALSYVFAAAFAGRPQSRGGGGLPAVDSSRLVGPGGDDPARIGGPFGGVGPAARRSAPRATPGSWSSRRCVT